MSNEALLGRIARKLAGLRWKHVYLSSKDIEEILALADGRKALPEEVLASEEPVRNFIASEFEGFLKHASFKYAVSGYLRGDSGRSELVLKRVRSIAAGSLE
ncbi:MAG: hypothetical protein JNM84_26470 [Planctomycetes bacterium]|nr:hypothetical protein [Planctomycetota bacterium]